MFSKGISTIGAAAESRIVAVDDPIVIDGTEILAVSFISLLLCPNIPILISGHFPG